MKSITQKDLYPKNVNVFLKNFKKKLHMIRNNVLIPEFEIEILQKKDRISPILKLAELNDAKDVVNICKNTYEGTYPYREFENEEAVLEMIKSSNQHIILFKDKFNNYLGCFVCKLFFESKKGYFCALMVKQEYQGKMDIVKAVIGSFFWMWFKYKNKISIWYCENRTAIANGQYVFSLCGFKIVGFLPNKDVFFHEIESDVLSLIYNEKIISKYRRKDLPKIIPPVNSCFLYSSKKFELGPCELIAKQFELDENIIALLKKTFLVKNEKDKFGYEKITFYFEKSSSFFQFIYTPWLQNFEKSEFKANCTEEFYIFIEELKKLAERLKIRYIEVYISAYEPEFQEVVYNFGLKPRGYAPCWKYNKAFKIFEDYIVFNCFNNEIKNIILLPEGIELLESLDLVINT